MSREEGSLREIRTALSGITRRLDGLTSALSRLAADAATPLPGDPLDEQSRARVADLVSLLAVGPSLDREAALSLALDRVLHRAGADCSAVLLCTPGGGLLVAAHRGFGSQAPVGVPEAGIVGRALRDREPIRGQAAHQLQDPLMREHALLSALAVPLGLPADPPLGVLFAGRHRAAPFETEALQVVLLMADRVTQLSASGSGAVVGAPLAAAPTGEVPAPFADLDLGRVAAAVARHAATVLGAPAVAVLLPGAKGPTLAAGVGIPAGAAPLDAGAGAIGAALRGGTAWTADAGSADEALARLLGASPRLVVPLRVDERVVAVLAAGGPQSVTSAALTGWLPQAAAAIRNARLFAETALALEELRAVEGVAPPVSPGPARDFASLLAVVLGRLAAVRDRIRDPEVSRQLDVAEEAAWRAAEAVRDLLGFAPGHRAGALAPLDLAAVVRGAVDGAQARWSMRQPVTTAAPGATSPPSRPVVQVELEPLPPIRGSAEELREAFDHLLENAAEATADGGLIRVQGRWDGGGRVEVVVEDRGAGMDNATRLRAPEPFFSTRGPGRLGLGLPVAQAIVARHRGSLEIESTPGVGTIVRVTLPTAAGGRPLGGAPGPGAARVLVVEDDPAVCAALVEAVIEDGHVALTAASGSEALVQVEREPVDAVFADLALPDGSGLEVARTLKRKRPGTPVVLVTAWPGRLEPDLLEASGIVGVIEKPVGLAEVRAALAAMLVGRGPRPA